jgi:hypothetical protein
MCASILLLSHRGHKLEQGHYDWCFGILGISAFLYRMQILIRILYKGICLALVVCQPLIDSPSVCPLLSLLSCREGRFVEPTILRFPPVDWIAWLRLIGARVGFGDFAFVERTQRGCFKRSGNCNVLPIVDLCSTLEHEATIANPGSASFQLGPTVSVDTSRASDCSDSTGLRAEALSIRDCLKMFPSDGF